MAFHNKNFLSKPIVLTVTAVVGGGLAVLLPQLRGNPSGNIDEKDVPPIVPIMEVQKQVAFSIYVPQNIPAGGQLSGARVTQMVDRGNASALAPDHKIELESSIKTQQKPVSGYGLEFGFLNDSFVVRAIGGSPAEKEGINSHRRSILVAVAGHPLTSEDSESSIGSALRKMSPLDVTVRDHLGRTQRIVMKEKGSYLYPDMALIPLEKKHTKQAALMLNIHGRQIALVESRPENGEPIYPEPGEAGSRPIKVNAEKANDGVVWATGPKETPNLVWSKGEVLFWLNNYQKAVSQEEALQIVESMTKLSEADCCKVTH